VWVNGPHWSDGAQSVIYKTRVACTGTYPSVDVQIQGALYQVSGGSTSGPASGPGIKVAGSLQDQWIATDYVKVTYYTPKLSSDKHIDPGNTFYGQSVGTILGPGEPVNYGSARGVSCFVTKSKSYC